VTCRRACNLCPGGISTTTPSTTQRSCVDLQSVCLFWQPYCNLLENTVPHPCPATCNVCGTTTTTTRSPCVDSQSQCSFWAPYCGLLDGRVPHPCPKTCNKC
jgi:hypothetical protein